MKLRAFVFKRDYGMIDKGRKLLQSVDGNYFVSQSDEEFIAGTTPWVDMLRFRKAFVEENLMEFLEEIENPLAK